MSLNKANTDKAARCSFEAASVPPTPNAQEGPDATRLLFTRPYRARALSCSLGLLIQRIQGSASTLKATACWPQEPGACQAQGRLGP